MHGRLHVAQTGGANPLQLQLLTDSCHQPPLVDRAFALTPDLIPAHHAHNHHQSRLAGRVAKQMVVVLNVTCRGEG